MMPPDEERPEEICCHVTRDSALLNETARLTNCIVLVQPREFDGELSIPYIASLVEETGLVAATDLTISEIPGGKYLILPPPNVAANVLAEAIPDSTWSKGFQVELWSRHTDSTVEIPSFQVFLDIDGIPTLLWREEVVAQAVGTFGYFLGTVNTERESNLCRWKVIAATSNLRKIPHKVSFCTGGIKIAARIRVRRWIHAPLFELQDLPKVPQQIVRPRDRFPIRTVLPEDKLITGPRWLLDSDTVCMSLTTMKEILKDIDPARLPDDMRRALQGDKEVLKANREQSNREATALLPAGSWDDRQLVAPESGDHGNHNNLKRHYTGPNADDHLLGDRDRVDKRPCIAQEVDNQVFSLSPHDSNSGMLTELPHSVLFPELQSVADEPLSTSCVNQTEKPIGQSSPNVDLSCGGQKKGGMKLHANRVKVGLKNKGVGQNAGHKGRNPTLPSNNLIAVVDKDGLVNVPLTVIESINIGDLVGFDAADVVKTAQSTKKDNNPNCEVNVGPNRIRTRSVKLSNFSSLNDRPKDMAANVLNRNDIGPQVQPDPVDMTTEQGTSSDNLGPYDDNEPHINLDYDPTEDLEADSDRECIN